MYTRTQLFHLYKTFIILMIHDYLDLTIQISIMVPMIKYLRNLLKRNEKPPGIDVPVRKFKRRQCPICMWKTEDAHYPNSHAEFFQIDAIPLIEYTRIFLRCLTKTK